MESLKSFFTGIADAIRTVKGSTDKINAQDFENEILNLKGDVIPVENNTSSYINLTLKDRYDYTYTKEINNVSITIPNNVSHGFVSGVNFSVGSKPLTFSYQNNSEYKLYLWKNGLLLDSSNFFNQIINKQIISTLICDGLNIYWYVKVISE